MAQFTPQNTEEAQKPVPHFSGNGVKVLKSKDRGGGGLEEQVLTLGPTGNAPPAQEMLFTACGGARGESRARGWRVGAWLLDGLAQTPNHT